MSYSELNNFEKLAFQYKGFYSLEYNGCLGVAVVYGEKLKNWK